MPLPGRHSGSLSRRAAASLASVANQCHLVFTGLDRTGVDLRSLTVTAHFGVDSIHKVEKVAGPIQASFVLRLSRTVVFRERASCLLTLRYGAERREKQTRGVNTT